MKRILKIWGIARQNKTYPTKKSNFTKTYTNMFTTMKTKTSVFIYFDIFLVDPSFLTFLVRDPCIIYFPWKKINLAFFIK